MTKLKVRYEPTKKQSAFHACPADEVLYGGAAGGGKSTALVMDALSYALTYPKSRIILFRRTYPELEETLIQKALEFYPEGIGRYIETKRRYEFLNGSVILFRYLEHRNDVLRYQGAEFDYIGFDELTHFDEFQFQYMKSRLRSTKGYPKYIRCTANPDPKNPTKNKWVKEYFIDFAPPMVIKKDGEGRTRCFIPATVYDNPYLLEKDPGYVKRLESLPELERQALLLGNWNLQREGLVYDEFSERHVKEIDITEGTWHLFGGLDFGATNPTALVCVATNGELFYVFDEIYTPDISLDALAYEVLRRKLTTVYADPSAKGLIRELQLKGIGVEKADNEVLPGIFHVKRLLANNRLFINPRCKHTLEEFSLYVWEEGKDKPVKAFDHAMDALRYALYTFQKKAVWDSGGVR